MQEQANEVVLDLQLSDGGYELDRQTQPPGDYLQDSIGAYEAAAVVETVVVVVLAAVAVVAKGVKRNR